MTIKSANIHFNEFGTPVAEGFDDVYFSNENGLAETQYVFIDSNNLKERWYTCTSRIFSIGETGFGTGLNFLLTAKQFIAHLNQYDIDSHTESTLEKLYYLSTEKYPLCPDDLAKALALWPDLSELAQELIAQYPLHLPGFHRLELFSGKVVLDLYLGDATKGFEEAHAHQNGRIDAWFLDGFAPSKNNDMWTEELYGAVARLSTNNASFATFTAAGAVKRGLKKAGFVVNKQKGFGRKREMLVGHIDNGEAIYKGYDKGSNKGPDKAYDGSNNKNDDGRQYSNTRQAPVFHRHAALPSNDNASQSDQHIGIVGGGIAAATVAYKLLQRNKKVTLFCADSKLAQGASGNDQGGFYPQLNAEAGIASQIHAHSFLYARRYYDHLLTQGVSFSHSWCGVLQLAFNDNVTARYNKMIANGTWPKTLTSWVNKTQASEIAGIDIPHDSLFLPLAGWISPPQLVEATIELCRRFGDKFSLQLNRNVTTTDAASLNQEGVTSLVFACGAASEQLTGVDLPFRLTRGQVERIPAVTDSSDKLKTVLCHKGYMTPAMNKHLAMGSTYVKNDTNTEYRKAEANANLAMHQGAMQHANWVQDIVLNKGDYPGRAAIRCSLPDHLPTVGSVPDTSRQKEELADLYKAKNEQYYPIPSVVENIFLLTGLGSRGLTTVPLMAELLASQICREPLPLSNPLLNALNPNRFLVKDLIRRQS